MYPELKEEGHTGSKWQLAEEITEMLRDVDIGLSRNLRIRPIP
jgi:hypothetical protein